MLSAKRTAYLMLLAAAMCWGFAFAAQDAAAAVPSLILGGCRSVIAGIFLTGLIPVFDRLRQNRRKLFSAKGIDITAEEWLGGILCGIVLTVASAFQQSGIAQGTDGGKAAFITAMYVVLVPIYSLFLKKSVPFSVWLSILLASAGFYLLCIQSDFSIVPSDLFVIGGTLLFPFHILLIDHYAGCDGLRLSAIQFFAAAAVNLLLAILFREHVSPALILHCLPQIFYLGIVSSGIAYTLQILAQKHVEPTAASLLLSLESVFGVLGTAVFLGQTLTVREYTGCAVVFAAVILSQLPIRKK